MRGVLSEVARLALVVVVLAVVLTVCVGFWERGQQISAALDESTRQGHLIERLTDENIRLQHKVDRERALAERRAKVAARERDEILHQLDVLRRLLVRNGIEVPTTFAPAPSGTSTTPADQPEPSSNGGSHTTHQPPANPGNGSEHGPSNGNGHGPGHNGNGGDGGGVLEDLLDGLPDLPLNAGPN